MNDTVHQIAKPIVPGMPKPPPGSLLASVNQLPKLLGCVCQELVRLLAQARSSLIAVADVLCLSPRTLQTHLRKTGHSYQQLLNEVRRELAEQYLGDQRHSIRDIASLLGFAEPSVFVRSARCWTGQTPGEFRWGA